jgi:hypothetical protein
LHFRRKVEHWDHHRWNSTISEIVT